MAMFTSESASSLLKAEETSSASSLPRNLAIQGYGTPRWKRYEKVKFHASYHILPYLTISYHILPYLTTLFALLVGFELFYWGLLYLETKSNQTNVMSHAN